jgi:hypothetical protein
MKHLCVLFALCASIAHGADKFFPEGWLLGTEFPDTPRLSAPTTEEGFISTTAVYEDRSTGAFLATRTVYPQVLPAEMIESAFTAARDGMITSMEAKLLSEEHYAIEGHEARRYILEARLKNRRADVRVIVIQNEMYLFLFATSKNSLDIKPVRKFFGGIATKKSGESPAK